MTCGVTGRPLSTALTQIKYPVRALAKGRSPNNDRLPKRK